MVVRHAIGEGARAAGAIGLVACRGPDVGAQEVAAAAAVEQDYLRRIAIRRELARVRRLEVGDEAVGEEIAVACKAAEQRGAAIDTGGIAQINAAFVEPRGDLFEIIFGRRRRGDHLGHGHPWRRRRKDRAQA